MAFHSFELLNNQIISDIFYLWNTLLLTLYHYEQKKKLLLMATVTSAIPSL
jgi:hypothetical protein